MENRSVKDLVKNKAVHFQYCRDNELWYSTDDGFTFPVPTKDIGTATFLRDDKAIIFMRWIRLYLEELKKEDKVTIM